MAQGLLNQVNSVEEGFLNGKMDLIKAEAINDLIQC